jgi:hypothetical protein
LAHFEAGKIAIWHSLNNRPFHSAPITDENGNIATIAYWGTKKKARESLATLKNCINCSCCSGCYGCSRCSGCYGRSDKKGTTGDHIQPIVPTIERIHTTVYEAASQPGALDMSQWHCGTTHCRAGWVITLAGEAGKALEEYWTINHAAWLIYKASDQDIKYRPDFFATNDAALADMKKLAEQEAAI